VNAKTESIHIELSVNQRKCDCENRKSYIKCRIFCTNI